jgi:hypothetical protein
MFVGVFVAAVAFGLFIFVRDGSVTACGDVIDTEPVRLFSLDWDSAT